MREELLDSQFINSISFMVVFATGLLFTDIAADVVFVVAVTTVIVVICFRIYREHLESEKKARLKNKKK